MHYLFEQGDMLNTPFDAFIFDTDIHSFPVHQHWHYYMEILYMLEGTAKVLCGEKEYLLHPSDMICLLPKALHGIYRANKNEHLRYYVLKFDLNLFHESKDFIPPLKSLILQTEDDDKAPILCTAVELAPYNILPAFQSLAKEFSEKDYGYHAAMRSAVSNILLTVVRVWRNHGFNPSRQVPSPSDHSIDAITEYIDQHSNQVLKVEDLASKCNMSYSFFAKKFKQIYGRSCKEYIEYVRVTKAEDMLLFTDFDLTFISQETGFSDCSHMIKTFKKYKNVTPKQYRLQNTK